MPPTPSHFNEPESADPQNDFSGNESKTTSPAPESELPAKQSSFRKKLSLGLIFLGTMILLLVLWGFSDIGPQMMAHHYVTQAHVKFYEGDHTEALNQLEKAFEQTPESLELLNVRGDYLIHMGKPEEALKDLNKLVEKSPEYAHGYTLRSTALQMLGRHPEAISDLSKALELRPQWDPLPWNNRAYGRALAGIELEQALADVKKALRLSRKEDPNTLDTLGFVQHLLGQNAEALVTMDRAIKLAHDSEKEFLKELKKHKYSPANEKMMRIIWEHPLAVMYHHRGLIHEKLGNKQAAQVDLRRGDELGYNPKMGVQ